MKTVAILLTVLVLAFGCVLWYGLSHTRLIVTGKGFEVMSAQDQISQFESLKAALAQRTMTGTLLRDVPLGSAQDYTYYIYSLRLQNPGLVSAEMVELQVFPEGMDVLCYGDEKETVIPPGQTRDVWCVLLTEGTPSAAREIAVTYYLWGHPQEMRYAYEQPR